MTSLSDIVTAHYNTGTLLERIETGLIKAGADPAAPKPSDLKGVDEFHIGGLEATQALLGPLGISPETRVLDIGSGIGGTARFIAGRYGATVTGIDLTPAFVEVARQLSARCGLGAATRFEVGSAYDLPMEAGSVDLAVMFHVGMNLDDKARLFAEVARVLAPGGRFALYDIMLRSNEGFDFPQPWASEAAGSFVTSPDAYREAAASAGLRLAAERDRHDAAADFFRRVLAATEANGPPPVGLPLIMGETARLKYGNLVKATLAGALAPWEMVFQAG